MILQLLLAYAVISLKQKGSGIRKAVLYSSPAAVPRFLYSQVQTYVSLNVFFYSSTSFSYRLRECTHTQLNLPHSMCNCISFSGFSLREISKFTTVGCFCVTLSSCRPSGVLEMSYHLKFYIFDVARVTKNKPRSLLEPNQLSFEHKLSVNSAVATQSVNPT